MSHVAEIGFIKCPLLTCRHLWRENTCVHAALLLVPDVSQTPSRRLPLGSDVVECFTSLGRRPQPPPPPPGHDFKVSSSSLPFHKLLGGSVRIETPPACAQRHVPDLQTGCPALNVIVHKGRGSCSVIWIQDVGLLPGLLRQSLLGEALIFCQMGVVGMLATTGSWQRVLGRKRQSPQSRKLGDPRPGLPLSPHTNEGRLWG